MTTKIIGGWNCLSKNQLKPMKYIQRTPSGKYRIKKNHGNNKIIHYGVYDTLEEAKLARDELIRKNWPLPIKKINPRRYIEETVPGSFLIRKFDEGKMVDYGTYYALEYAQYIRDNLEKCNWDKTQLPLIIKQYPKYYTDSLIFFKNIRYEKGSNYPWKISFMKWHDGKNFIKMYSGFSKLEDALWERDLLIEYGDDWQSYAEDTRPNPYKDNIPYYWITQRPHGFKTKNIHEDLTKYAKAISEGYTTQTSLSKYFGVTSVTIRKHIKRLGVTFEDFKNVAITGEDPLTVFPLVEQIIKPPINFHERKLKNVGITRAGTFRVYKKCNYHNVYYGTYASEKIANKVVDKLMLCNWDKKELPRIHKELGIYESKENEYIKVRILKKGGKSFNVKKQFSKNQPSINCGTFRDIRIARLVRDNMVFYNWDKTKLDEIKEWAEYDVKLISNCWRCQYENI